MLIPPIAAKGDQLSSQRSYLPAQLWKAEYTTFKMKVIAIQVDDARVVAMRSVVRLPSAILAAPLPVGMPRVPVP